MRNFEKPKKTKQNPTPQPPPSAQKEKQPLALIQSLEWDIYNNQKQQKKFWGFYHGTSIWYGVGFTHGHTNLHHIYLSTTYFLPLHIYLLQLSMQLSSPSSYQNHGHHCQQVKIISLQHDLCNKAPQGHQVKSGDRKLGKQALSQ